MKILGFLAKWLLVLCLPVLLVTASLAWAVNSFWLYKSGLEKYDITRVTGISQTELDKAAAGLIHYFNSNEANISLTVTRNGQPFELFNQREANHLRDVKGLIWLDYRVLLATLAYAAIYIAVSIMLRRRRELARALLYGSGFSLALMMVIGAGIMLDFEQLFIQFHLLSFSNDLWQLDPARDYLIMMFPEGFWNDAAVYIALAAAGMAIVLGGVSAVYLKLTASQAEQTS
ncbi:MAG: TIGR01906 family membrane protein [Dehalococcoidales bacterium]|nr:TIGR01906 family membrane protein [Dehalococcoidales bacterium]